MLDKITSGRRYDKDYEFTGIEVNLMPIYGGIPCGELGYLDDNIEGYIEIPESLVGTGSYFVLQADGDSMIGAGINDSDLVIIRKQDYADDGDIVVAFVDSKVTLKRYYKLRNIKAYRLHAENEAYEDKIVKNCQVLGVAVKILKDLRG